MWKLYRVPPSDGATGWNLVSGCTAVKSQGRVWIFRAALAVDGIA